MRKINAISNLECCRNIHAKVFEIILIIGFISSLILLSVNLVLTMWLIKYSIYIFIIEIVLIGFNFITSILAIILRAWRSNGSVENKNNSSAYCISIIILLIIIISLLGSLAIDYLISYIINLKLIGYMSYSSDIRRLEDISSSDSSSASFEENELNITQKVTEISYGLDMIKINATSGIEKISDSVAVNNTEYIPGIENISDSGIVNNTEFGSNITNLIDESDNEHSDDNNIDNSYNNYHRDKDEDILISIFSQMEKEIKVEDLPSDNMLKTFNKIFNKYDNYFEENIKNIHNYEDLKKIDKKENNAKLFSYISLSYNALIQIICLITLIFILKRINSRSNYGLGVQAEIGVSSFQNIIGNNNKSKLIKGKNNYKSKLKKEKNNIYSQNTDNFTKKSKKKKGKKDDDYNEGSDNLRIMSKKNYKKKAASNKKKH